MSDYLNYYGRNSEIGSPDTTLWGFSYLGPILIPPVPATCGMTDRNPAGTGIVYYLMWDGESHLVLTDQPPRAYTIPTGASWNTTAPAGQDVRVYGPWDGPYLGAAGVRLGVTTAAVGGLPAGTPHLQFDLPAPVDPASLSGLRTTTGNPPVCAPDIAGPQTQSYPEPSNYPAPGVPTIPGIPSSTPPPTGGGLAAFVAAYATNTPPLILAANLPAIPHTMLPGWHLQHYGA